MKRSTKERGDEGEELAVQYLKAKGFKIITRNFRFGRGEIDIIAEDGKEIVFVEVKTRKSDSELTPEEAVTISKENMLKQTAEGYIDTHFPEGHLCRFDIVAVEMRNGKAAIRHIREAF